MNGHEYGGEILPKGRRYMSTGKPTGGGNKRSAEKWPNLDTVDMLTRDGKSIPCGNGNQSGVIDQQVRGD